MPSSQAKPWWKRLLRPSVHWLAVFIPISVAINYVPAWHNLVALFICACLAMGVISAWIGSSTEQLARRVGPTWGGLVNASFGNLPELIFGLIALNKGMTVLVKAAWTGAILGNLLLVLGTSMLLGGLRHGTQNFPRADARDSGTALAIAAFAIMLPTIYQFAAQSDAGYWDRATMQHLSFWLAWLLLLAYAGNIIMTFQRAHREKRQRPDLPTDEPFQRAEAASAAQVEKPWPLWMAVTALLISSVLIALMSDYVSDSVGAIRDYFGWTNLFLGVIIIAAIGNVATQYTSAMMALKDDMDLSFQVGISAAVQVALMVVPILILFSHLFGTPVSLLFTGPEIAVLMGSIFIANMILTDGTSNWFKGLQMLLLYVIIAVLFYYLPAASEGS